MYAIKFNMDGVQRYYNKPFIIPIEPPWDGEIKSIDYLLIDGILNAFPFRSEDKAKERAEEIMQSLAKPNRTIDGKSANDFKELSYNIEEFKPAGGQMMQTKIEVEEGYIVRLVYNHKGTETEYFVKYIALPVDALDEIYPEIMFKPMEKRAVALTKDINEAKLWVYEIARNLVQRVINQDKDLIFPMAIHDIKNIVICDICKASAELSRKVTVQEPFGVYDIISIEGGGANDDN